MVPAHSPLVKFVLFSQSYYTVCYVKKISSGLTYLMRSCGMPEHLVTEHLKAALSAPFKRKFKIEHLRVKIHARYCLSSAALRTAEFLPFMA